MPARIWIWGEGKNELGPIAHDGKRELGVIDAVLMKVRASGWVCDAKHEWKKIRKYVAGGATGRHGDFKNVRALVLMAVEGGADAVAFTRDVDSDQEREAAVNDAIAEVRAQGGMPIVIGGTAKPAIEAWILALRGVCDTDNLSRAAAASQLAACSMDHTEGMTAIIEGATLQLDSVDLGLPPGTESLQGWLRGAQQRLEELIDGV